MTSWEEGTKTAAATAGPIVAPFGSWHSPISVELVSGAAVTINEPSTDGDERLLARGSPDRGRSPDAAPARRRRRRPASSRPTRSVRATGSTSTVAARIVADGERRGRLDPGRRPAVPPRPRGRRRAAPITPEGPWRYADLRFDPRDAALYAVRETHDASARTTPAWSVNEIVALALDGPTARASVLVTGPDFVAAPRPSPDGRRLAWLEWDHPGHAVGRHRACASRRSPMTARWARPGRVAGGPGDLDRQPEWSPAASSTSSPTRRAGGTSTRSTGPDGLDGPARNLAPMDAELADPAWVFDRSVVRVHARRRDPRRRPAPTAATGWSASTPTAPSATVETPFTEIEGLRVAGEQAVVVAAGPADGAVAPAPGSRDRRACRGAGALAVRRRSTRPSLPVAEPITFPTTGGAVARALFFPPTNGAFRGPGRGAAAAARARPTAARPSRPRRRCRSTARSSRRAGSPWWTWTTAARPATGAPYRDALKAAVGDRGRGRLRGSRPVPRGPGRSVDPARMAIRGGSAGGYTTLARAHVPPRGLRGRASATSGSRTSS